MVVTIYKDIFSTNQANHIPIGLALTRIQEGKSKQTIALVRNGDKESKKKLPVVLFSGTFSDRKDEAIQSHSGFIVLDFDHVNVDEYKRVLSTDDIVYSCWRSPSGDGVKVLVRISNPERHRDHFRALQTYFEKQYGYDVDPSGINESRACFESYDPEIVVNEAAKTFSSMIGDKVLNQNAKVIANTYTDYTKLNIAAAMIRNAEDGEKHVTLIRAGFLCGGYISAGRMEEDEVIRVLMREISKKDVESLEAAHTALVKSIEEGKLSPIREIIAEENKIKRELMLEQMDMSFIAPQDEDLDWIHKFAEGKIQMGLETGSNLLDQYFRYKKEFFIFNGHANVGKTTFALYLMVNSSMRHGWKWIIYSAENKTASIKSKLMQFAGNKQLKDMSYHERKFLYDWVTENFVIINNHQTYSYYDIIMFAEKIMANQQIDGLFVDPYNALKIDLSSHAKINTHEYHYEAASEFLTFSNARNIAVWLNTHAVTEAQRRIGDDGLPVAPWGSDTEGGGKFMNRADSFGTFHRKVQSDDPTTRRIMEFHVRKVRETETGGMPTMANSPVYFQMNSSMTGYNIIHENGKPLFDDLFTMKNAEQRQTLIEPSDSLDDIF